MKKSILLWLENELFSHLSKLLFVPNLKRHHCVRVGHHLSNRTQTQSDENPPRSKRIQTQWEISQPPKIAKYVPTHQNWDDVLAGKYKDMISGGPIFIVRICDWMYQSYCSLFKMLFKIVIFMFQIVPRALLYCFKKSPR